MSPGVRAVDFGCAGYLAGVSRNGESQLDDLLPPSAIYPQHPRVRAEPRPAESRQTCLFLRCHVPRRRRSKNQTLDTPERFRQVACGFDVDRSIRRTYERYICE
jgi:hypothetical protein